MIRTLKSVCSILPVVVASLLASASVHAAVLFEQAPNDGGDALDASFSLSQDFGTQNAESYTLGGPSTVTGIRWWGTRLSSSSLTSLFVVRRFDTLAINPGDPDLFETLTGTVTFSVPNPLLQDSAGNIIVQFDLALAAPISLTGSGYLSVFLDSDQEQWFWLDSATGDGVSPYRGIEGDPWAFALPDLSLALLGEPAAQPVPEPGSLALLGIAALAGVASRRRRPA